MYVRTQDKLTLLDLDKFHEIGVDLENLEIYAVCYLSNLKVYKRIGAYKEEIDLMREYDDLLDSLTDEEVMIHEVE